MEKFFSGLCLVFLIFLPSLNPLSSAGMSVVDYYRICPAKYFGGSKPTLEFKDGQWTTNVGMGMAPVDIKNGYIECSAIGDGEDIMQFVLYIKSDTTPVIAINRYYHPGVGPGETSYVKFYEYRNKEFTDITRDLLPDIDFRLFITKGFNPAQLEKIKSFKIRDCIGYRYVLPQQGTTIITGILLGGLHDYLQKNSKALIPGEKDLCEKFREKINYTQGIELKWDAKKDTFTPGKKVKLPY